MKRNKKDWIRKIKALYAKANGGTPEEVQNAILQARRIQAKFAITDEEIENSRVEEITGAFCIAQFEGQIPSWIVQLAGVIAEGFRVYCVSTKDATGLTNLCFYGTEDDCNVAFLSYEYCKNSAEYMFRERRLAAEMAGETWETRKFNSLREFFDSLDNADMFDPVNIAHQEFSYYIGIGKGIYKAMMDQNECEALVLVAPALVTRNFNRDFPNVEKEKAPEVTINRTQFDLGVEDGERIWKDKKSLRKGEDSKRIKS